MLKRPSNLLEEDPVDHQINMDMQNTGMGSGGQNPSTDHMAETGMDTGMDTTGVAKKFKQEGSEMGQPGSAGRDMDEKEVKLAQLREEQESLTIVMGNMKAERARVQAAKQAMYQSLSKDEAELAKAEAEFDAATREYYRVWGRLQQVANEITSLDDGKS